MAPKLLGQYFSPKNEISPNLVALVTRSRQRHSRMTQISNIEILIIERVCLRWSNKHFWQKKLVKSLPISTLDKAIFYKGTFLQDSMKPLLRTQNRLETS
jgi:hypothetical protein